MNRQIQMILLQFLLEDSMSRDIHLPFLYAENCPDQPTIPHYTNNRILPVPIQQQQQEKISRAVRIITKKQSHNTQSSFEPKIIKSPKSVNAFSNKKSFQMRQHQREVHSMNKRIKDCKNIQQRRKDHNDPLLYPPYFVRDNLEARDVRVDGLFKKAIGQYGPNLPHPHNHTAYHQKNKNSIPNQRPNADNTSNKNNHLKPRSKISHSQLKKYHYSLNMSNVALQKQKSHNNQQYYHANDELPTFKKSRDLHINNYHTKNIDQNPETQEYSQGTYMPSPMFVGGNNYHSKNTNMDNYNKIKMPGDTVHYDSSNYQSKVPITHSAVKQQKNKQTNLHYNHPNHYTDQNSNQHANHSTNSMNNKQHHYHHRHTSMIHLPENDVRHIIQFIYDHCLYKANDLEVLRMRMLHQYGKQQAQSVWRVAMKLMHREQL